ncbi:MAG: glycosyltransferase family 4 protein [Bacteroidales bacterium]|nr:glycosyltransferase family 4 protein [Bacteroidales bacterium]
MKTRLLVFHPAVAPYRIDFFNTLAREFEARIVLSYENLRMGRFHRYEEIRNQLEFSPLYLNNPDTKGIWAQLDDFLPQIVIVPEYGSITIKVLAHRLLKRELYKVVAMSDDCYDMLTQGRDFTAAHCLMRSILAPWLDEVILPEPKAVDYYQAHYGRGLFFPIIRDEKRAIKEYTSAFPQAQALAEELDLADRRIFISVSRLESIKNIQATIRAFSQLDREANQLLIVGEGSSLKELKHLAETTGADIRFLGRLEGPELAAAYLVADCLVLSSICEPFGAVVNEALLAGCRCLVSNRAGAACLVEGKHSVMPVLQSPGSKR